MDHLEQGRFSQSKGHKLPPAPVLKMFSIAKYLQMQQQRCLIAAAVLHAVILFKDIIFPKFLALPQTALSMKYGIRGLMHDVFFLAKTPETTNVYANLFFPL